MKSYFLYHSGTLIETDQLQLFIDVIDGVEQLINYDKQIYFLVTHGHADHFDSAIYNHIAHANVYYILSDDIDLLPLDHYTLVAPDQVKQFSDFKLKTYGSTDKGVSFIIELNGQTIFHAGDLNWWHWQNDSEAAQKDEEAQFKAIAAQLPQTIDLAFVPCDPRLVAASDWAMTHIAQTKRVTYMVPIHFNHHFESLDNLKNSVVNQLTKLLIPAKNQLLIEL